MAWARYGELSVPAALAGAPWWVLLVVVSGGTLAYVCKEVLPHLLPYLLARRALDKVDKGDVHKVLSIATGKAAPDDEAEATSGKNASALLRQMFGRRPD